MTMLTKAEKLITFPKKEMFTMPLAKLDSFEGIKAISQLMRQWEKKQKENTYKSLAMKAGLHRKTVEKIASRETMAPRLHTILSIMSALGFTAVRFE